MFELELKYALSSIWHVDWTDVSAEVSVMLERGGRNKREVINTFLLAVCLSENGALVSAP